MDYEGSTASLERATDLGTSPQSVVRRWLLELKLADKREKDWRDRAEKVWKRYRQKDAKKNSFNILWSNTETLRPAVYNSLPQPDVRRRYKDNDQLGKAVSEVLKRSLSYGLDTQDFDGTIKAAVLDMLLPGRAVVRVRYVPNLTQVGVTEETHDEENEAHEPGGEALEGDAEEVEWEQAPIEHVQYDDYRQGPGKCWSEVQWVAFRHRLTRKELEEKFGDIGADINLDSSDDEDIQKEKDEKVSSAFLTAELWEIWDKDESQVLFIAPGYKDGPVATLSDPLRLQGFFPIPRPLYAIEDSSSTIPVPLYALYQEQAEELDRINTRINKIVDGLKLRGVYDATITELAEVMRGQDNDLIPAQNVTALLERGGLEKAIWMLPIEQAANVLKVLFEQRESAKQVIYEITGIADIIRGASIASETATAQQIKDKWGSMRLKRMQSEVARFIRDLMRLQAELIGEKFDIATLQTMTGLKFPTMEEKQQTLMQWQQQALMAQQQGQQPPPQPQLPPAWEEIQQCLRDDAQRTFKVDVETDSTVAASVESDMAGLRDILQGVTQLIQGLGPAVQMGALPVEALKEIIMVVARRSKMGNAVEDALDQIKQPPPPQPEKQQQDNSLQVAQINAQVKQSEIQQSGQLEQAKLQQQGEIEAQKAQANAQIEQMKVEFAAEMDAARRDFERWKAQLDAETKIAVAQISAETSLRTSVMGAQTVESPEASNDTGIADLLAGVTDGLAQLLQFHDEMKRERSTPKEVKRGPDGKIAAIGNRQIVRGPDGRVAGIQ